MRRIPRSWIAGGVAILIVVVVLIFWIAGRNAASLAAVTQALSGRASQVAVRMTVERPDQPGEADTFEGRGTIFSNGQANLTYDFSSLPNAGGFFGHLSEFEMRVAAERVYLQVLPGERSWLVVERDELEEFARADIERIREVVLASPYLVYSLLSADGLAAGPDTVTVASSPAELIEKVEGFSLATFGFLDLMGTDPIKGIFTVDRRSYPQSLRYALAFPVAEGAADKIRISVTVDFQEIGIDAEVQEPTDAETTTFAELLGEESL